MGGQGEKYSEKDLEEEERALPLIHEIFVPMQGKEKDRSKEEGKENSTQQQHLAAYLALTTLALWHMEHETVVRMGLGDSTKGCSICFREVRSRV